MTVADRELFLSTVQNLARYHREHEKFYARAPLESALALSRTSDALKALAERWSKVEASAAPAASPYAGAEDLNDDRAIGAAGVLFMEGEGEPAEILRIKRELAAAAQGNEEVGTWLDEAMRASWAAAEALLAHPELADLLGERHAIIANDWRAASLSRLMARHLERALAILERIDFSPTAIRDELAAGRHTPAYLFAAAELIDHAADLSSESARLVHENERRWRVFKARIEQLAD
jgi:hypothetical protein